MFSLIRLLLRASPGAFLLAGLMALVAGAANAGALALLTKAASSPQMGVGWFAAACVGALLASSLSHIQLQLLTGRIVTTVRLNICRSIVGAPLQQLEALGTARLTATVTEDVSSVVSAATMIP